MKHIVLWELENISYTLVARVSDSDEVFEYVCAYGYDKTTKTWTQGHYFKTLVTAYNYMVALLNEFNSED